MPARSFSIKHPPTSLVPTLIVMSLAAGSMDALVFFGLHEVFTSAMSGNTILLGLALGQGRFDQTLRVLMALSGYIAGVAMASIKMREHTDIKRKLQAETVLLIAFSLLWMSVGTPQGSVVYLLIAVSAVAMGIQGTVGRFMGVPSLTTVVFTSTYTAIVSGIVDHWRQHQPGLPRRSKQQLSALLAYLCGAALVGFLSQWWLAPVTLIPLMCLLILLLGQHLGLFKLAPESNS